MRIYLPLKRLILFVSIISLLSFAPISPATANTLQTACVIGSSTAGCAAFSPQELYNLYGTTTDGTSYISVNGNSTQVYLLMNRTNSDDGGWILMMKGTKTSTNFDFSSSYFTSNTSTLNTTSLTNDVATDAKFSVYNNLSVKKLLTVFKDPTAGSISGLGVGDINPNAFGGLVWTETLPSTATTYATLTTNRILSSGTFTNTRYSLYRESNSAGATQVFSYQNGVGTYGFNISPCSSGVTIRWGVSWNNESDYSSCDAHIGIGVSGYGTGDFVPWNQMPTGSQGVGAGKSKTGFQIWGKLNDPAMGAPRSLSITQASSSSVTASWLPPISNTPSEYVLQYKLTSESWANSTTRRVTTPTSTPSVTITGLSAGTYDYRVWARDSSNSQSSATPVTATSQSLDTTAPTITGPSSATGATSSISVAENSTAVHTFTANETVTWSKSGTDQSFFSISSGGALTITARDFESRADSDNNNTYVVVITATDSASNATNQTLTVTITNINEAPTISSPSSAATHSITQAENISSVATYTATDVDAGTSLSWSISGTDAADFAIVSGTGVLTFATAPDYEAPADSDTNNTYILIVTVSDGSLTDTQTVTITITNANESASIAAPTVSGSIYKGITTTITVTSSVAGKVRFFAGGKRISTCLSRTTTGSYPNYSATCSWKPAVQSKQLLTATITPTDNTFSAATSAATEVRVERRTNTR